MIIPPEMGEFDDLILQLRRQAKDPELNEKDIASTITKARYRKNLTEMTWMSKPYFNILFRNILWCPGFS